MLSSSTIIFKRSETLRFWRESELILEVFYSLSSVGNVYKLGSERNIADCSLISLGDTDGYLILKDFLRSDYSYLVGLG
jgi:hypothetical protein